MWDDITINFRTIQEEITINLRTKWKEITISFRTSWEEITIILGHVKKSSVILGPCAKKLP